LRVNEGASTMIALEKLLLLKSVTLFKQTHDDLLLQIVESAVKEKTVIAGELLFQKGDAGLDMYVIVNGRVKIHNGDLFIKEIGDREIFGELAALSFGTRVASVSAITDCLLLKISSPDLYEVMNLDIGLAKGIIKALCERTQSISMQLEQSLRGSNSNGT
jgi:CRP/FNR family cyclic AMP-dependent transcriptional regulator